MADTAAAPNNRAVVYRGKSQRECPRMSGFGVAPLRQSNGEDTDMPWSGKSFGSRHNHSLSGAGAAKAASIANAILKDSGDEGNAIRIANSKVKGMRKRGRISDKAYGKRSAGLDGAQDVDAATS
jgi:hypothetical protein